MDFKTLNSIISRAVKDDFKSFVRKSFFTINPGIDFKSNWHIDLICDVLLSCYNKKHKRVIINLPPRSLKSICVSVCFPAWVLGVSPVKRIIVCTYSNILSNKHSTESRRIMSSNWYKNAFPESIIASGSNTKSKFATKHNGYYFATSLGSTLLGEGGNIIILDDPQTPQSVSSRKSRKKTIDWFQNSLITRLNDKNEDSIVLVTQRLHEEDLTGYIINSDTSNEWLHIKIPAIANFEHDVVFDGFVYKKRNTSDVMHPERESVELIEMNRKSLGLYNFVSQYQQEPVPAAGNLVKKEWIVYYDESTLPKNLIYNVTIDCAKGIAVNNDYSVITTIARDENGKDYIIDVVRKKVEYPDLRKKVLSILQKTKPANVLIEDASNGSSLIQELKRNGYSMVKPIKPRVDKVFRFNNALMAIESGLLLFPEKSSFTPSLLSELLSFPFGKHDDQVDTISQYFTWQSGRKCTNFNSKKIRFI